MSDIITELANGVARIELNRPARKNAMTSGMYTSVAGIFADAVKEEAGRVVLWRGAGDSFCAGNDVEDVRKNPHDIESHASN